MYSGIGLEDADTHASDADNYHDHDQPSNVDALADTNQGQKAHDQGQQLGEDAVQSGLQGLGGFAGAGQDDGCLLYTSRCV